MRAFHLMREARLAPPMSSDRSRCLYQRHRRREFTAFASPMRTG